MTTIATVRMANLTDEQRAGLVPTVIPVPDQVIANVAAVGARPISAPGATEWVQWAPYGNLYASGNPRRLRIWINAEMVASSASPYQEYDFYGSQDILITDDVVADPTWTLDTDMLVGLAGAPHG